MGTQGGNTAERNFGEKLLRPKRVVFLMAFLKFLMRILCVMSCYVVSVMQFLNFFFSKKKKKI